MVENELKSPKVCFLALKVKNYKIRSSRGFIYELKTHHPAIAAQVALKLHQSLFSDSFFNE